MRGVGDKRALPTARGFEPAEHVVGASRPAGVSRRPESGRWQGVGSSPFCGDLLCTGAECLDRSQRGADPTARPPPPAPSAAGANPDDQGRSAPPAPHRGPMSPPARRPPRCCHRAKPAANATTRTGPSTPNRDPSTVIGPARAAVRLIRWQRGNQPIRARPMRPAPCPARRRPAPTWSHPRGSGAGSRSGRRSAPPPLPRSVGRPRRDARSSPTRSTMIRPTAPMASPTARGPRCSAQPVRVR